MTADSYRTLVEAGFQDTSLFVRMTNRFEGFVRRSGVLENLKDLECFERTPWGLIIIATQQLPIIRVYLDTPRLHQRVVHFVPKMLNIREFLRSLGSLKYPELSRTRLVLHDTRRDSCLHATETHTHHWSPMVFVSFVHCPNGLMSCDTNNISVG